MTKPTLFLGIDLGTSLLKLQVIDANGTAIATASAPIGMSIPRSGWAEQNPDDWWSALLHACRDLFSSGEVQPASIAAIGLSGQMHGAVFVDRDAAVLRPCLIWADARTEAQLDRINQLVPPDTLLGITGNSANTSFTAAKILWVQEHEPDIYRVTRQILLPKDYLRLRLSGDYATDVSDSSATLLFDLAARNWSPDLLGTFGIDPDLLPPVHESANIAGRITVEAGTVTGLIPGTPIVAGGGDAECGAFGLGLVGANAGIALTSIGTSGQIFTVTDKPLIDPRGRIHALCHVVPGCWHVMGAILAGGVALRWLRDILTPAGATTPDYDSFTAGAASINAGADDLLFLPYLLGERTPHMDPAASGVFFGLRLDHSRDHLVRAVLEGVVLALRDGLEVFHELGIEPTELRAVGGGARSQLWRQIQRDCLALPIRKSKVDHGAAYGAALLAAMGSGAFNSATDVASLVELEPASQPDMSTVAAYAEVYRRYRRLYPALAKEFRSAGRDGPASGERV